MGCTRQRRGQRATSPSGEMEQGGPGAKRQGRGKRGDGETEPGKGVIWEGVEENPRGEGEPGQGYLLGVCPPAVPPESG